MNKRNLGKSDLMVAPLVLGGNVFGWTIDEKTSFQLLDQFVDAGFNMIDTADVYSRWADGNSGGESETIIGKWLKKSGRREEVLIATKVGGDMGDGKKGLTEKYIKKEVEESLRRLQTDHIDLYQSHFDDTDTPVEEPLDAYATLITEGKVRVIGASNFKADRLKEALEASEKHGLPRYQCYQPEYNLYDRKGFEEEPRDLCIKHDMGVISYFSLASGFLTGKYRSEDDLGKSQRGQGVKKYLDYRGRRILKALDEVAEVHGASPASVSLAWVMARPGLTAPIASATESGQLEELVKAAQLNLSDEEMEKLNQASSY